MESNPMVRELRDKIEQLSFRLTECKNENQMLKRSLQQAKRMVYKEVGASSLDFQDMLKRGSDSSRKQRMETIIHLKRKLQQLQDYLNQLEGTSSKTQIIECPKVKKSEDKKDFWKIELERRKAKETTERDVAPLLEESNELRRRLAAEKTRFKELREEVNLLRAELDSQIQKNESDMRLTKSFKTIESQIQDTVEERAEIRRELVGCKARNKRLDDEVSALKGELQTLHTKAQDNNMLIDCYTRKHKQIQEAIEAEKSITQEKMNFYKLELQVLKDNYDSDMEILDSLRNIFVQKHQLLSELKQDIETNFLQVNLDEQSQTVLQQDNLDEQNQIIMEQDNLEKQNQIEAATNKLKDRSSSAVFNETETHPSDEEISVEGTTIADDSVREQNAAMNLQRRQLHFDIAMYQKLLEASRIEKERLQYIFQLQERQMNGIATQVVETGRLVTAKDIERSNLRERITRMQRTLSKKALLSKNELEDLRIKIGGQKEENEFLRNFLLSSVSSRTEDFTLYKKFLYDTKNFFEDAFQEIIGHFSRNEPAALPNDISVYSVN
ncbi:coiled-coil domain-containing protein 13-like isoform X2 [Parasteatoda tepidariorum]|nr:myosin-9-like isoform X2 [Parasteatoda tepidariorum]